MESSNLLLIAICGSIGGFVNCLIVDISLTLPYIDASNSHKRFNLGFFTNIILGMVASLLVFGLGAGDFTDVKRQIAILTLSGIGGGNLITSLLQKRQIALEKDKMTNLSEIFSSFLKKIDESTKDRPPK